MGILERMAGPRVFLSHSTKDEAPAAVRDALAEALRQASYRVLLDKDGLQEGEEWHKTLELWMGTCDAAVLLLSEAALRSAFVAHEVSVLSYRRRHDPRFVLLPVFLRPVDYAAVEGSLLAPSRVTDLQAFQAAVEVDEGVDPPNERVLPVDQAVAQILQRLAGAVEVREPLEEKIEQLGHLLAELRPSQVEAELERLDVHFDEAWIPGAEGPDRLARHLACALIGAPLKEAKGTISRIRAYLAPKPSQTLREAVLEALDLIASSWVSTQSAQQIEDTLARGDGHAFALDCQDPLTTQMYVNRACPKALTPTERWPTGGVSGIVGEDGAVDLEAAVRKELKRVLKGVNTDAALTTTLETYRRAEDRHVFVSLPARAVDVRILDHLRGAFPGVSFFLRTGTCLPEARVCRSARIEALCPPFEATVKDPAFPDRDEASFVTAYEHARDELTLQL